MPLDRSSYDDEMANKKPRSLDVDELVATVVATYRERERLSADLHRLVAAFDSRLADQIDAALAGGASLREIASLLEVSPETVRRIVRTHKGTVR
jgi:DNA-binding NarL/FixJ family response regulator